MKLTKQEKASLVPAMEYVVRNMIRWDNDYVALMFNDRYGYVHISKENLDSHN